MENQFKLTEIDAWLLLSILYSKKKNGTFDLKHVIEVGDIIQHSIFEYEEINIGIGRLILTGYLSISKEKITVTEEAEKILKAIEMREGIASPIKRFQQLKKELQIIENNVESGIRNDNYSINLTEYISKQEYQYAIKGEVKRVNFLKKTLKILAIKKGN